MSLKTIGFIAISGRARPQHAPRRPPRDAAGVRAPRPGDRQPAVAGSSYHRRDDPPGHDLRYLDMPSSTRPRSTASLSTSSPSRR